MKNLAERARWRVAGLLDKLPGQCWSELVMWALKYKRNPWSPQDAVCRSDAARVGACYCGKLRKPEGGEPR
ncbi:hypothetical protein [Micromonospora sp. CB01531]|uniref:hypothetical protein n=1 Tax=Micromonospora sp. CB01531 TaxID=1718947 RepID=UPI00093C927B|nr:hypothetical protein [Micromonospora sp. CB01531]OKI47265.1 hypothetical protein A6A27_10480 [Micromonospora sp. CB01531]